MSDNRFDFEKARSNIEILKQEIDVKKEQIQKLENSGRNQNKIKLKKEELIYLLKELFEKEQILRREQINEIESIVKIKFKQNKIDENEYVENMSDINRLFESISQYGEVKNTEFDISVLKNNNQTDIEYYKKVQAKLEIKKEKFSVKIKNYFKSFLLHQKVRGRIIKNESIQKLEQKEFTSKDIDMGISEMYNVMCTEFEIQGNKQKDQTKNKINIPDLETVTNADELYAKMSKDRSKELEEIIKKSLKELEKRTSLEAKEEAKRCEKLHIERNDIKRRVI